MCGIAGYIGKKNLELTWIQTTLSLMHNRGPDYKSWVSVQAGTNQIYLLHTRLSIIDLDPRSNQPFTIGDYSLIFNGEIYNYKELRERLRAQGVAFKTESDTEVLLQSYIHDGENCVEHFEGMWAFAIYNSKTHQLFLSRDRFLEKPLYIWTLPDGVYFGSEIKFLKSLSNEKPTINQRHITRNLVSGYKSLYKTSDTFFEQIKEIPYATNVSIDENLHIQFKRYWYPKCHPIAMTKEDAIAQFRQLLLRSVELRLRADVPMAFCLSGGVDSAAIASIARKIFKYEVATFSIVDQDERYNELGNIQATVADLKCPNTIIHTRREGAFDRLRKLVEYHDGPLATISYYVHSFLSEAISEQGFKVACSGTGADELLTGYYDHFNLYLYEMRNSPSYLEYVSQWRDHICPFVRNPCLRDAQLYADRLKAHDHIYADQNIFKHYLHTDFNEEINEVQFCELPLRNRMFNEMFHEVVPVILHEDDLNSMFYSVENRSPYLDTQLFNFAVSIPSEHLISNAYGKYILREAVQGILNDKVRLDRQKKGFNASINSVIDFNDLRTKAYLLEDSPVFNVVRREKIKTLMDQNTGAFANHESKFLFNFINTKIFLELNN